MIGSKGSLVKEAVERLVARYEEVAAQDGETPSGRCMVDTADLAALAAAFREQKVQSPFTWALLAPNRDGELGVIRTGSKENMKRDADDHSHLGLKAIPLYD